MPPLMPANDEKSGFRKWLDRRTGLDSLLHHALDEPIPGGAKIGYVFGSGLTLSVPLTDCHRGFLGDVLRAISGPRPHHGRVHHKRSNRRLVLAEHSRLRIERNHHRAAASSDADFSLWILQS